jgi:hypothetical protein
MIGASLFALFVDLLGGLRVFAHSRAIEVYCRASTFFRLITDDDGADVGLLLRQPQSEGFSVFLVTLPWLLKRTSYTF